jgi:hypothetical protein
MNNPTPTPPLTLDQKRALLTEALRNRARAQISVAPLSYGQRALWFLYRSDPESAAYHVSFSARIRSHLDVSALKRAFQTLMDRHPCLRSHVRDQNGEPVQQIHGHLDVHFEIADCRALDESALRHAVDSAYRRPFELQRESPLRVNLFDCGANDTVLLITVHHIAYDAWSLWLNLDEIQHLYAAESGGVRSALPLLEVTYRDHIESQERMLASPQGEQLWAFWKRQLAGAQPTLNVPTDRPRPPVQSYRGTSFRTSLPSSLSRELKKLAQAKRVTPFMLLLAAYQVLLYRYSGQDDILVGSPTTGRGNAQFNNVVGYFVNPVVLRANLAGNPTFEDFLQQVFQTSLNAFQHQDYPFPLLVERLQPQRDPSYAPLFQVSFVYQKPQRAGNAIDWLGWMDASGRRVNWGGLEIEYYDLPQQEGQFDLELEVMESDASLRCLFKYNVDLFDAATILRFASHFETLLTAIAADPKQHIDSLPLLSEAERHTILWDWNATKVDYPQRGWVHQVFEQQVQATPASVALTFGDEHLSYAELNKRVNRLAHCLRTAGIGRGSVVGVCLHRSIDMVVALHAVVKAGAAYLPLDPDYPSDRVQYMAKDAAIALLLSHAELLDRFEFDRVPTIALDDECLRITRFPATNPDVSISGDDIAYVIYRWIIVERAGLKEKNKKERERKGKALRPAPARTRWPPWPAARKLAGARE